MELNTVKTFDRMFHYKIKNFYIKDISKSSPGIVTQKKTRPHYFQDGDFVTIDDVEGMTEVNGLEPRPIKVLSPYTFSIEDTSHFPPYIKGGHVSLEKVLYVLLSLSS